MKLKPIVLRLLLVVPASFVAGCAFNDDADESYWSRQNQLVNQGDYWTPNNPQGIWPMASEGNVPKDPKRTLEKAMSRQIRNASGKGN